MADVPSTSVMWKTSRERQRKSESTKENKNPRKNLGKCKSDGDGRDRTEVSKPKKERTCQKLKTDQEALVDSLETINQVVLIDETASELKSRFSECNLGALVESLCTNDELMKELVEYHRSAFVRLYSENGKKKDSFLVFEFHWHQNCSTLLLEEKYKLTELSLDKTSCANASPIRNKWLEFCK